jgi:ankyrin repeat protein
MRRSRALPFGVFRRDEQAPAGAVATARLADVTTLPEERLAPRKRAPIALLGGAQATPPPRAARPLTLSVPVPVPAIRTVDDERKAMAEALSVSAMHKAARRGDLAELDALLTSGVPVDAPGPDGRTALQNAASRLDVDAVRALLHHKAQVDLVHDDATPPLVLVFAPPLSHRLRRSARSLHAVPEGRAAASRRFEVARALLLAGADVNARADDGATALDLAVALGDGLAVKTLVHYGADPEQTLAGADALVASARMRGAHAALLALQQSMLPRAIVRRDVDEVRRLLDAGVSPNAPCKGCVPLHVAAQANAREVLQLLLARGADVHAIDAQDRTALTVALGAKATGCAAELFLAGCEPPVLEDEAGWGRFLDVAEREPAVMERLVVRGDLATVLRTHAGSFLTRSAVSGNVEVIRRMLSLGAHVDAPGEAGRTALHEACNMNSESLVALLLENGAQVSLVDERRRTPLHLARTAPIARRLLDAPGGQSHLDARDATDNTPLHAAALRGDRAHVELLIERGADLHARNHANCTALDIAVKHGRDAASALLRAQGASRARD